MTTGTKYEIRPWSVRDIISRQYRKGRYNRLDIFVRYACVEAYFSGDDWWWKQYRKMQYHRNLLTPSYTQRRIKEFHKLIESMKTNGFDYSVKGIRLDSDYELVNGSHRLAVALYLGMDKVGIKYPPDSKKVRKGYSAKWFTKAGFKPFVIERVEQKRRKIFKHLDLPCE